MKKVLSLVLVIAMVLSSMSFAFASTFEDIADTDYAKAIETLTALGVVTGYEDGTYRPEKTVTRAEMAKLIVELLGYGDLVAGSKSNFADTQGHWADAWIALAAGKGLVVGTGDGKFTPDRTVSYDEAITMIVRSLGYTDNCNQLKNMTWPTNFKVKAAELDITDGVKMAATGADRGGVAQLMYNALDAVLVTINSDGDVVESKNELLSRLADLNEDFDVTPEVLDADNSDYAGNIVDLAPYMFQNLDVYLNDDDEVVYIKGTNSLVLEGTVDKVSGNILTVKKADGTKKDVDFGVSGTILSSGKVPASYVYENGSIKESDVSLQALYDDTEAIKIVADDAKALGGDGDGKLEANEIAGIVTDVRSKVVRIEKVYVAGKDSINGIALPEENNKVDLDGIKVTGDAETLEDIEVDDIVVAYASEDDTAVKLVVTRNVVEGKVTKVTDKNTVSIDGKSYDLASKSLVADWALELGDEGLFYMDQFGEIADYDGEAAGPTDYAVIFGSENGDVALKFGKFSVDDYPELKLATQEGEEVVYEVAVEIKSDGSIDDSAVVTSSKVTGISTGKIFSAVDKGSDNTLTDGDKIVITSVFNTAKAYLVKYSLDSDGRIDELEVIADVTAYETKATDTGAPNLSDVDLDSDDVIDSVVIFDAGDDYAIVDLDSLDTEFEAYSILNKDGEIEVLVVRNGEVDQAADVVYAYLNKVTLTYNASGNKVHLYEMYVDGQKKEVMADDDMTSINVATYNKAISVDFDGDVIDESEVNFAPTGYAVTATAISASKGKIQLDFADNTKDGWYDLSEHATIIEIDPTVDSTPNSVNGIKDLYDIDTNDNNLTVYINTDGDIDLIVITEQI